jgi:hypothetical protein
MPYGVDILHKETSNNRGHEDTLIHDFCQNGISMTVETSIKFCPFCGVDLVEEFMGDGHE